MKRIVLAALLCATAAPAFAQAPAPQQQQMVSCPRPVLVDALNMINEPNKFRDGVLSEGMQLVQCLQPPEQPKPEEKPAAKPAEDHK